MATMNIEKTVIALSGRLGQNPNSIDLTLKQSGHRVTVEQGFNTEQKKYYWSVWFSQYGKLATAYNIEDVAEWLCTYPAKPEAILKANMDWKAENEPKLNQFFTDHIKGHTEAEYRIGSDFYNAIYTMWKNVPEALKQGVSYIFDEKLNEYYANEYRKTHPQFSVEELINALNLVNDCAIYSDWHKDVRGYRPRYSLL